MTTREDRERAARLALNPAVPSTQQWVETGVYTGMHGLLATELAAAFAAHRLAERERVAKMLDAKASLEEAQGITSYDVAVTLRELAEELRSGR